MNRLDINDWITLGEYRKYCSWCFFEKGIVENLSKNSAWGINLFAIRTRNFALMILSGTENLFSTARSSSRSELKFSKRVFRRRPLSKVIFPFVNCRLSSSIGLTCVITISQPAEQKASTASSYRCFTQWATWRRLSGWVVSLFYRIYSSIVFKI